MGGTGCQVSALPRRYLNRMQDWLTLEMAHVRGYQVNQSLRGALLKIIRIVQCRAKVKTGRFYGSSRFFWSRKRCSYCLSTEVKCPSLLNNNFCHRSNLACCLGRRFFNKLHLSLFVIQWFQLMHKYSAFSFMTIWQHNFKAYVTYGAGDWSNNGQSRVLIKGFPRNHKCGPALHDLLAAARVEV